MNKNGKIGTTGNQFEFPSPTGVNYYEWFVKDIIDTFDMKRFPSPTGVNYYES